jgi:very-short-patch-repair endonuclease
MPITAPPIGREPLRPFTRRDLPALGLTRHELDALLVSGAVVQPVRGAYLDARLANDATARAEAVGLVLPAGAALAHRTAAWLHGIDPRGPGDLGVPLDIECLVPLGYSVPRRAGLVARQSALPETDVVTLSGVPVTSTERTALDLARYAKRFMALAILDAFANAKLVTTDALSARLDELKGQRGVAQARALIEWADPAAESFGESWLRLRVLDAGFPRPELQIWMRDEAGLGIYRLDLGWPHLKVAVEYDGEEFHTTPEHRLRDMRRRERLAREWGWHCIGVGKGEVLGQSLRLERGIGDLLGMSPQILRRTW